MFVSELAVAHFINSEDVLISNKIALAFKVNFKAYLITTVALVNHFKWSPRSTTFVPKFWACRPKQNSILKIRQFTKTEEELHKAMCKHNFQLIYRGSKEMHKNLTEWTNVIVYSTLNSQGAKEMIFSVFTDKSTIWSPQNIKKTGGGMICFSF